MGKPCRHLNSLSLGKLTDRLSEGPVIPANICISCTPENNPSEATMPQEIFACLTCFETFCSSSNKGPSHLVNHSRVRNHPIYFKFNYNNELNDIEDEFYCALCGGPPRIKESGGKKDKVNLEKIKGLFQQNLKNSNSPAITKKDQINTKSISSSNSVQVPKGLVNLGNTCFMNSALQLLAVTLQRHGGELKTKTTSSLWNSLIYHLEEIYKSTPNPGKKTSTTVSSVNPKEFLNLLTGKQKRFASMQQQDAHDFLRLLFNSVAPESPQTELFGGKFVSKVICDRCRNVSETIEPFLDISFSISESIGLNDLTKSLSSLSIENQSDSDHDSDHDSSSHCSILNLLRYWNKKIILDGENGYYCENCSPKCPESPLQSASLQFFLTPQLPPFLILHLQRFKTTLAPVVKGKKSKTSYSVEIEKDDKVVEFPAILSIPSECILNTGDIYDIKYKLYGYIIHEGSSTSCGHYTAVVQSLEDVDEKWFYISDTRVKEIPKIRALDGESFSPYLLFYQRIN